jgi:hypothetical protein
MRTNEDNRMIPNYEVVSPIGDASDASISKNETVCAEPLDSLAGKKIGLVWTVFANGDTALRAIAQHLGALYSDLEFVEMEPGQGLSWGDHPDASIADLARQHGIDGAIIAAGC